MRLINRNTGELLTLQDTLEYLLTHDNEPLLNGSTVIMEYVDKNLSSVLPDLDKYPRWEKQIIIVINNCEGILSWQKYYVVNFFSCGEQRKEYIQWCLWEGDIHITGVWVGNPKHKKDLCVLQHFVIATHLVIRVAGWSTQFRRQLRPVANCNYFIKPIRNAEIFWTTKSSEESSLSSNYISVIVVTFA